jgi:CO dehydrogenase maturation factor
MKIAFIGKGGSGKSTACALFIRQLLDEGNRVLAIDADINMHLAELIGAERDDAHAISYGGNPLEIRTHLMGTNPRIKDAKRFVKTTPPGAGSSLIEMEENNPVLKRFAHNVGDRCYFMHVGTYREEEVGTSCYHSNLAIVENVLSHTKTKEDEWVVVDMVAGSDMFAGPLYLLFDAVFFVAEPTPESRGVFEQIQKLAVAGGTLDRICVVGNKVQDADDESYIRQYAGDKLVAIMPLMPGIKRARQRGKAITPKDVPEAAVVLADIQAAARKKYVDPDELLKLLHNLHARHAKEDYIIARHGDLSNQIDMDFSFHKLS